MNNTEASTDMEVYMEHINLNKEIIISFFSLTGTFCTACLGLCGVFINKNFKCGCCPKKEKDDSEVNKKQDSDSESEYELEPEPESDPESVSAPSPAPTPSPTPSPKKPKSEKVVKIKIPKKEICRKCQILETPLDSFLGIIRVNESNCWQEKFQCKYCSLYFCPFHLPPNQGLVGGHRCAKKQP